MPTYQQVINGARKSSRRRRRSRLLNGQPQISGTVINVLTHKPKKPNSANRTVVKVRLSSGQYTFAYVPGEGHNLQPHSKVLLRGGVRKDLIGIRLMVVRGAKKYDCSGVKGRRTSRSSYGTSREMLSN